MDSEKSKKSLDIDFALMTASELATVLHISKRTLWRMKSAGKLPPPVRLGGAVRWGVEAIRKWIASGCPDAS